MVSEGLREQVLDLQWAEVLEGLWDQVWGVLWGWVLGLLLVVE